MIYYLKKGICVWSIQYHLLKQSFMSATN